MDAKQAVLAGALLNAELMEQRDIARDECDRLRARVAELEAADAAKAAQQHPRRVS